MTEAPAAYLRFAEKSSVDHEHMKWVVTGPLDVDDLRAGLVYVGTEYRRSRLHVDICQWVFGDVLNWTAEKYGEVIAQQLGGELEEAFNIGTDYVRQWRRVSERYEAHERMPGVSWAVHRALVAKDKPDRQKRLEAVQSGEVSPTEAANTRSEDDPVQRWDVMESFAQWDKLRQRLEDRWSSDAWPELATRLRVFADELGESE